MYIHTYIHILAPTPTLKQIMCYWYYYLCVPICVPMCVSTVKQPSANRNSMPYIYIYIEREREREWTHSTDTYRNTDRNTYRYTDIVIPSR